MLFKRRVNVLISLSVIVLVGNKMQEDNCDRSYIRYINEIDREFAKEMAKKHGLRCIGDGGSMPYNIESVAVMFVSNKGKVSIEEARCIGVDAVEILLNKINSHEKIRKYLKEYPFKAEHIEISISFRGKKLEDRMNGHVALALFAKNKAFYDSLEQVKEIIRGCDGRDPKNIIYHPPEEVIIDRYVSLLVESFDDAKKIANQNCCLD